MMSQSPSWTRVSSQAETFSQHHVPACHTWWCDSVAPRAPRDLRARAYKVAKVFDTCRNAMLGITENSNSCE